ncbi:YicC/YloC family endoribonuclease [Actibacterium pelagium]|nr:YicC/YloC family endoribonuclease [Actibacterium pelagium]
MTGYASLTGQGFGHSWVWELRSVNARGLDLRPRLPDWIEGLEPAVRTALKGKVARGNLSLSLKIGKDAEAAMTVVNQSALEEVLAQIKQVETAGLEGADLDLAPTTALAILNQRGVLEQATTTDDTAPLRDALLEEFAQLVDSFNAMRKTEGDTLHDILSGQIERIETLNSEATQEASARKETWSATIKANLEKALEGVSTADPERVAQELALIVVKTDVTEELDRLTAHIATARELLAIKEPVGRKLDFLTQEFNREANTLCSKSQSKELTRIGLDLKVVIDQMREQVQNVE